ncbi:MAG TPA: STAS domain-containing protein [Thermoanaerobaculaceae bacterium]|nr:STAS domain-containing protein [Thermoanaerobaculaceae bacterium]
MEISARDQDGCIVVAVVGRLDSETSPELERYCTGAAERGCRRLVLDLELLEFISSAGFRAILASVKRMKPIGGRIAACSAKGVVADAFAISGFANFMPVEADVPSAVRAL